MTDCLYHVAPRDARQSIEQNGITRGSVTGVWLEARTFAEFYRTVEPQRHDYWEIDAEGLQLEPDEDYTTAGIPNTWAVREPIAPRRLSLCMEAGT